MKKSTKIMALLLVAVMLCPMLGACGDNPETTGAATLPATAQYSVKVVDPLGQPVSDLGVKFMQNGEQVAMAMVNAEGVATKELDRGEYNVVLSFMDVEHSYYYNEAAAVLSATQTQLEIVVGYKMSQEKVELTAGETVHTAYPVDAGCTYVNLASQGRNFFIFTPSRAGVYEVSAVGADVTVGYYGSPFFIYSESALPVENGKFSVTIEQGMIGTNGTGTTQMVIGADAAAADTDCFLCIQWVSEPPAQVQWEDYVSTYNPAKFTLDAGMTIHEFDLSADTYNLVFNEEDGYYHLDSADGPLVLVRLLGENPYTGFAFGNILLGSNFGTYHYDENGELVRKVLYNDCMQRYLGEISGTGENKKFTGGMCDDNYGVYPLTKDLETVIKEYCGFKGYWDSTSSEYVLGTVVGLNEENAWLFVCCYAQ